MRGLGLGGKWGVSVSRLKTTEALRNVKAVDTTGMRRKYKQLGKWCQVTQALNGGRGSRPEPAVAAAPASLSVRDSLCIPRELVLRELQACCLLPAWPRRRRVSAQPRAGRELALPLLFAISLSTDLLKQDSNLLEAGGATMRREEKTRSF